MGEKVRDTAIAAEWGVEPVTVRRWRKRGLIPFVQVGRRVVRYDPQAVREALQSLSSREQGHSARTSTDPTDTPAAQAPTIEPPQVNVATSHTRAPDAPAAVYSKKREGHGHAR